MTLLRAFDCCIWTGVCFGGRLFAFWEACMENQDYMRGQFPDSMTTQELAEWFGYTPEWVQRLVGDEVLEPAGTREFGKGYVFHPYDAAAAMIAYQRSLLQARKPKDEKTEDAVKRKAVAEADLKEFKAEQERVRTEALSGTIHRAEDVEGFFLDFIYAARELILTLPVRMAKDGYAAGSQVELEDVARRESDAVLEELSRFKYSRRFFRDAERERLRIERENEAAKETEEDDGAD